MPWNKFHPIIISHFKLIVVSRRKDIILADPLFRPFIFSYFSAEKCNHSVPEVGSTPQMGPVARSSNRTQLWIIFTYMSRDKPPTCTPCPPKQVPTPPGSPNQGTLTSVPNNRIQWQFQDFHYGGTNYHGSHQHPMQTIFGGNYMKTKDHWVPVRGVVPAVSLRSAI